MPRVSKEQIERAKSWDLLSYLQRYEPQELKGRGRERYTASHDSLKISNGMWHWHSRGIGGRTALDYLIKVRGMDFVSAVEMLSGEREEAFSGQRRDAVERPRKPFRLPKAARCGTKAASYLLKRGIDADIIQECVRLGILYESYPHRNCVFVGKDKEGRPRHAFLRGTHDEFQIDAEGSDKRFGFCLPAREEGCGRLAVAESPIDALSLASIRKLQGEDWGDCHYLSLGGTSPRALIRFLCDHPGIQSVSLCMDNDGAGQKGMERIRSAVSQNPELAGRPIRLIDNPAPKGTGKDYNNFLQGKREAQARGAAAGRNNERMKGR